MNKMYFSPTFRRTGKAVILISFLVGGCAGSPSEVRYDDTTRKYSIGRNDGRTVSAPPGTGKEYTVRQDHEVTDRYILDKDEDAKTYTIGKNDGLTAHYILKEGPPPGTRKSGQADKYMSQADAVPDSAEAVSSPIVIEASDVLFEFDKAKIKKEYYPVLDEWVKYFQTNPRITAEILGHTDSTGPEAYNQRLSERRAASVVKYLLDNGIEQGRITARGFGERLPVAPNTTPEGRQKNRRVEVKF